MTSTSTAAVGSSSSSTISTEEVAGPHVLTINGYTRNKQIAIGEFLRSSTFVAAGHRWSIKYFPNSRSDGDWISTELQLDDQTCGAPDVKARFTISLLDLNGKPVPSASHTPHTSFYTFCNGTTKGFGLIKRKVLEHSGCLFNDSFRIRYDIIVLKVTSKGDAVDVAEKFVVVPPPDMGRHRGHLLSTGEGADITLEVDGDTFPAHRNILAARSLVFKAQLFGPMKEDATVCMWIDGIEAVYTDSLPEIEEGEAMAMAQHLLVAADRYSVQRLKLMCEDKLCNHIDTNSVGTVLALAEQHGCEGLKRACLQFLMAGGNLKAAIETDGFDHLSKSCPSVLKELLANVAL